MFFKKAKPPHDGDYIRYINDLQKGKISPEEPLTDIKGDHLKPIDESFDNIKASHKETMHEIKKENDYQNKDLEAQKAKAQDLFKEMNKSSASATTPDDKKENEAKPSRPKLDKDSLYHQPNEQWQHGQLPRKPQTQSKNFNKKTSIPLILCFIVFLVIGAVNQLPIFVILMFSIIFLLGIVNNKKRKK